MSFKKLFQNLPSVNKADNTTATVSAAEMCCERIIATQRRPLVVLLWIFSLLYSSFVVAVASTEGLNRWFAVYNFTESVYSLLGAKCSTHALYT